jgi:hypothetical protein
VVTWIAWNRRFSTRTLLSSISYSDSARRRRFQRTRK